MTGRRRDGEAGSTSPILIVLIAAGCLAAAVLLMVGSWLAAVDRAAGVAEAAALAAAEAAHPDSPLAGTPRAAAERVARQAGATVRRCVCPRGARRVVVEVVLPVGAGVATAWLVGEQVTATATARSWSQPAARTGTRAAVGHRGPRG